MSKDGEKMREKWREWTCRNGWMDQEIVPLEGHRDPIIEVENVNVVIIQMPWTKFEYTFSFYFLLQFPPLYLRTNDWRGDNSIVAVSTEMAAAQPQKMFESTKSEYLDNSGCCLEDQLDRPTSELQECRMQSNHLIQNIQLVVVTCLIDQHSRYTGPNPTIQWK